MTSVEMRPTPKYVVVYRSCDSNKGSQYYTYPENNSQASKGIAYDT